MGKSRNVVKRLKGLRFTPDWHNVLFGGPLRKSKKYY